MGFRRLRRAAKAVGAPSAGRRQPFHRPVDRLAVRLHLLLAAVATLMLVLTVGATVGVYDAESARAADQQIRTHPVTATITAPATATGTPVRPATRLDSRTDPILAAATWQWAGDPRAGTIELPAGVSAHTQTSILVDSSGNWAGPEITGPEIAGNTTVALVGALALATALTAGLHTWCTRILDRHRQRYWDEALHRLFATYGK